VRVLLDAPEREEGDRRFEERGGFTVRMPSKIGGVSARSPARNFTSLAASSAERIGRGERGELGLYRCGLGGQLRCQ
jgi:hypothetical protein